MIACQASGSLEEYDMNALNEHWGYINAYTHVPHNNAEYEKLLNFVEELMEISRHHKKDERVTSLLKMVAKNIEEYEARRYPAKPVTPIEMLEFADLMHLWTDENHKSERDEIIADIQDLIDAGEKK